MEPKRQSKTSHANQSEQYTARPGDKKHILNKRHLLIPLFGLLAIALLASIYTMNSRPSLVPKKIQQAVDFSIYYPGSLPPGYTLDIGSFQLAESGVILFKITYGDKKDMVFSEQQQPSGNDIDKFVSSYLPLNSGVQLPLGQAKVGAYGSAPAIRTVLSLPIRNGPWLIVTAPSEVSHDDLVKILTSLTK